MVIRPADQADLEAIREIQDASPEASQWDARDYLDYDCIVAQEAEVVIGFLASRDVAGEREILNVAVRPESRGRGVGSSLLSHELKRPAAAWFLEVRESNHQALKMYARAGFQASGKRSNYYADPIEGAIVMSFYS